MIDTLFDIPETPSPRLKWMRENRIKTHHAPHMEESPWMAIRLTEEHWKKEMNVSEAMAEECRLYDEAGELAEADTEDEAIVNLARKLNLKLWNQP